MGTHTVGAFAIILDDDSKILLCHRTDRDMWNLPGGRVEANESPWKAVIREVAEEAGLVVRVERLLGVYSVPARTDFVLNFLCIPVSGEIRLSDEADAIQWFNRADIPPNTLPRQRERIDDAFDHSRETTLKIQT